jgi:exonuclease III
MEGISKLKLDIGAINVNSFNVSTLGSRNSKTELKIEGVTSRKHEVLFFSDCRLGAQEEKIKKLLGLNRNCSYKVYFNSNLDSRGVGIAIKRSVYHEILDMFCSVDQNIILLKIKIKGCEMVLGSIYGPNEQKPEFFLELRQKLETWGLPYIIGGDFNTILDRSMGGDNKDKEGGGRIPNSRNSEVIGQWIEHGDCIEPFRAMYPEQKETSYIPFRGGRGNNYSRTRLDFFLISRNIINIVGKVVYEDRLGKDFDHKMTTLNVGRGGGNQGKINIYNSTLEHKVADKIGIIYIFDALNNHLEVRDEELSNTLGGAVRLLTEYMEVEKIGYMGSRLDEVQLRLNDLYAQIEEHIIRIPDLENMLERAFSCEWEALYEVVASSLKNKLLFLQNHIKIINGCRRNYLVDRLVRIRDSFGNDSEQAADCLRDLNDFDDGELKLRANKYKEFLLKNNEKPTRAFCLLGKENNLLDDMNQIKNENGQPFVTKGERDNYIKKYYEDLYKKKMDNLLNLEDFLGMETLTMDWVGQKKLNEVEKNSLEGDITLEELEKALNSSNMQSSSGWDGISYVIIKKYFGLLGPLLANLAREGFAKGKLCPTFRLGLIKLIPKKGDANRVQDWRPITLLCCGYKLISGVIAQRLERYLQKIIGRSQKGFQRVRNMNSCTLNIMDRIAGAWESREEMGVLCVDFVKAFDSVEHAFIKRVMEFFNFGNLFVGMVMTLLAERGARVMVEDRLTDVFKIERGTPQGDRASPYIFIICIEILLIKLKSIEGRGLDNCDFIRDWVNNNGLGGEGTAEGFADDLTLLFKYRMESMGLIMEVMNQFKLCSGLELNKSKTQLMVVGTDRVGTGTMIMEVEVVGFVKILGLKIDRKLCELGKNWDDVIRKLEKLCNFWRLQRLSIVGRILIAKTYLMSNVNFLMGSIEMSKENGDRVNEIMANYVKGTDRVIAKKRWGMARELGGYGLVDAHTLNTCIKSAWINKWIINVESLDINGKRSGAELGKPVDQWGVGEFGNLDKCTRVIMGEWKNYKRLFYKVSGNFWKARLFENDGLVEGRPNLGAEIFGNIRYNGLSIRCKTIRLGSLVVEGRTKDKTDVERELGERINMAEYFRLRNILMELVRMYGNQGGEGKCLDEFIRAKKRGGGALRREITGKLSDNYRNSDPRELPSSITLWGNEVRGEERGLIESNFGLWGKSCLENEFRNFLFNFMQGRLYLNNVLYRIRQDENRRNCTFCVLKGKQELALRGINQERPEYEYYLGLLPVETVDHLFWSCEHVQGVIQKTYRWIIGAEEGDRMEPLVKETFMRGCNMEAKKHTVCDLVWKHYVKFFIYRCRQKRKVPIYGSLIYELKGLDYRTRNLGWASYSTYLRDR